MRECVGALLVEQGMILLGKRAADRGFYPDVWDIFGGHLNPGESCEQALRRELLEELAITPTQWLHLLTAPEPDPHRYGAGLYHFYVVTAWEGSPTNRQPHEHTRIQWFPLTEAMHLELAHTAYVPMFAQLALRI